MNIHVGKHGLSTIKSLGLDKPVQEAIKSLVRELHLKPETSKLLHGKIKFLVAVLMDPDECQTDQDCWEKYGYGYDYCYCTSTCVDVNWWCVVGCVLGAIGCALCAFPCAAGPNPMCIACLVTSCGSVVTGCILAGGCCNKWERRCDCGYLPDISAP